MFNSTLKIKKTTDIEYNMNKSIYVIHLGCMGSMIEREIEDSLAYDAFER